MLLQIIFDPEVVSLTCQKCRRYVYNVIAVHNELKCPNKVVTISVLKIKTCHYCSQLSNVASCLFHVYLVLQLTTNQVALGSEILRMKISQMTPLKCEI